MKASRKNREVGGRTKTKTTMATKERKLNGGSMEERETEREREKKKCVDSKPYNTSFKVFPCHDKHKLFIFFNPK